MYADKKTQNWNNEYITQFIDAMHCPVFPLSCTRNTKTILPLIWCLLICSISLFSLKISLTGIIYASEFL